MTTPVSYSAYSSPRGWGCSKVTAAIRTTMNSTSAAARMTQLHRFLLHQAPAVSRSAFPFFRFMGVSSVNDIWLQHNNFRP